MLTLPFKPFTLEEVHEITDVGGILDSLVAILGAHMGEDQVTVGLDYMQTFAVFVHEKYVHEGAPIPRAISVMKYVSHLDCDGMLLEFRNGRNFPVPRSMMDPDMLRWLKKSCEGMMVPAPDSHLGKTLRLDRLHDEFRDRLAKVFPNDLKLNPPKPA